MPFLRFTWHHAREIILTWGANIRANYFNDDYVTMQLAKELKATGCKFLSFGAESGNQRVLDLIKKDITVEQIIHSAEVCFEADIMPIYSWMVGIPTQTKEDILDTIDVMKEISRICPSAIHYPLWIFRPFPGGSLFELCIEKGLNIPKTLRDWPEVGADSNENTGFFAIKNMPWIDSPEFVEFVSKHGHEIPGSLNENYNAKLNSVLVKMIIWNWGNFKAYLGMSILEFAKRTNHFIRKMKSVLT